MPADSAVEMPTTLECQQANLGRNLDPFSRRAHYPSAPFSTFRPVPQYKMAPGQKMYPRATVKKIVKAHSNRNVSKNVDVMVSNQASVH